jgi:signal transduction histidine kinase
MSNISVVNVSAELMTSTSLSLAIQLARSEGRGDLLHTCKMAALGELASGITHDFRNILQTVISTLELIESRSANPAEVQRIVASALCASERGIGFTNRLLAFSRHEIIEARPAHLLPSLEGVTETLARTVGAGMQVGLEAPPADLWQAVVNPTELELALINLGINARDAMPGGGSIRIAARNVSIPQIDRRGAERSSRRDEAERRAPSPLPLPGGDYIAITVGDTGVGMDAATLARAVKPFFTTKSAGKGTGLGLAMAHTLATESRGALRLISKLGQGTTVELWLPRAFASPKE